MDPRFFPGSITCAVSPFCHSSPLPAPHAPPPPRFTPVGFVLQNIPWTPTTAQFTYWFTLDLTCIYTHPTHAHLQLLQFVSYLCGYHPHHCTHIWVPLRTFSTFGLSRLLLPSCTRSAMVPGSTTPTPICCLRYSPPSCAVPFLIVPSQVPLGPVAHTFCLCPPACPYTPATAVTAHHSAGWDSIPLPPRDASFGFVAALAAPAGI